MDPNEIRSEEITDEDLDRAAEAYKTFLTEADGAQRAEVEGMLQRVAEEYERFDEFVESIDKPGAAVQDPAALDRAMVELLSEDAEDTPEIAYLWNMARGRPVTRRPMREPTVTPRGGILGSGRYQLQDIRWLAAGTQWLLNIHRKAPFEKNFRVVDMPDTASVALLGDWGTGYFSEACPASKVCQAVKAQDPDYTIHLGDVYYSGDAGEVETNFLPHWPGGRLGTFALNSNHEMYVRGRGIFEHLLKDPRFEAQGGATVFALENSHWVIVGLDSARFANKFNLYRTGRLDDSQQEFLRERVEQAGGRGIIVLTHHNGLELRAQRCDPLWSQVRDALGGREARWYWGHLHSAIVYRDIDGIRGRCCGHGAMPRGRASIMDGVGEVNWFEQSLANDPDIPPRVVNGFAMLRLDGAELQEVFIDENGHETLPPGTG